MTTSKLFTTTIGLNYVFRKTSHQMEETKTEQ